ncbi:MAG: ribonuclease HII [Nanoarchaeota archaeon]
MVLLCGIDDAGRGPVVGPLVMCGVLINADDESKLKDMGAKDSKLLTPRQREGLAERIKEFVTKYKTVIINPAEIDDAVMGKEGLNLNWLEALKSVEIINALKPDRVILDCPSPNIPAYTRYLAIRVSNKRAVLHCAHKADVLHPIVSAASIIAKVTRDEEIEKLKKSIKMDFGSGYPSDPRTIGFLKKYWNTYPQIFRHTWAPYKKAADVGVQQRLS